MKNSNTKKVKKISEATLLVTIDMGKVKHTGYYRFPDVVKGKIFEFSNSRNGFEDMWQRVCHAKRSCNLMEIVVGFEATRTFYGHKMPINGIDSKDSIDTCTFISILLSKIRAF